MNDELSLMIINFFGQLVQIRTNEMVSATTLTDAGNITETYPLTLEGILIDEDDTKFYYGENINNITGWVDKSKVIGMEIVVEIDPYDQVLDEMIVPENTEEIN